VSQEADDETYNFQMSRKQAQNRILKQQLINEMNEKAIEEQEDQQDGGNLDKQ